MCPTRHKPIIATLALTLHLAALAGAPRPDFPPEFEAAMKRTLEGAKALGAKGLPDVTQIGPEWKLPWQLPQQFMDRAASEEAYWERSTQNMLPAGLSKEEAEKFVAALLKLAPPGADAGGMGEKQIMAAMLSRGRADDLPPHLAIPEMLDLTARTFAAAPAPGAQVDRRAAQQKMIDLVLGPYKDMPVEKVREALVAQTSLARQRTAMTYFQCKDWDGYSKLSGSRAAADKGIWVGQVKVRIVEIDTKRTAEMPDLAKDEMPAMQAKLTTSARGAMDAGFGHQEKIAKAKIDAAKKEADEAAAAMNATQDEDQRRNLASRRDGALRRANDIEQEHARQKADFARLAATIEPRNFGDNSYVIRFTGVTPDTLGGQGALNAGWIRKDNVCVWIEVSGNFPEPFMTEAMNTFMKEIDANFISSLGAFNKALPAQARDNAQPPIVKPALPDPVRPVDPVRPIEPVRPVEPARPADPGIRIDGPLPPIFDEPKLPGTADIAGRKPPQHPAGLADPDGRFIKSGWDLGKPARTGGASFDGNKLKLELTGNAGGSATAWSVRKLEGDFDLTLPYSLDDWDAKRLLMLGLGIRLDSPADWNGDRMVTLDRIAGPDGDTVTAALVAQRGKGSSKRIAGGAGELRIRRVGDEFTFSARESGKEWVEVAKMTAKLSPKVDVGLTLYKTGRGDARVTIPLLELTAKPQ